MLEVSGKPNFPPVFLGNGVTTSCMLYYYLKANPGGRVVQIYDENALNSVDHDICILVTHNGIERGVNSLGDLLLDSFEYFKRSFSRNSGVREVKQYHLKIEDENSRVKFERRFGRNDVHISNSIFKGDMKAVVLDAFLVNGQLFKDSLLGHSSDRISKHKGIISSYSQEGPFHILRGPLGKFTTKEIYSGLGPFSKFLPYSFIHSSKINRHKTVCGGVWSARGKLSSDSFVISLGTSNLIYDSELSVVQISGISNDDGQSLVTESGFENNHRNFDQIVQNLPSYRDGRVITSYRDKGRHRMPYVYELRDKDTRIVSVAGAYKNGYTLSPYLTRNLFG